jgi:hypothetical protein
MFKCEICLREFKSLKGVQSHALQTHYVKSKDYYDKYLKKEDEGKCYCGSLTKYINITTGYHKYCSIKCQSNDPVIIEKRVSKVRGDNHWTIRNKTGPNKGKTYDEIHGVEKSNYLKRNLSEKGKLLVGENNHFYGKTHNEENIEIFRNKRLGKTYEEIYGYEKATEIKNKLKKDNLVKTDWRNYWSEYPFNFQDKNLRFRILKNQNYKCPICFKNVKKKFAKNLHHINYVKNDNRRRNLIYLCISCHIKTNTLRSRWKLYLSKINREIIRNNKLPRRCMLEIDKEQSLEFREKLNYIRRIQNG